jgi:hypothetical protein
VANFSLVCYYTNDDELLSSSKVPRLFEDASFLKMITWVMGKTTHPFLPEELDSLHKGRHDHTGSCLPYGSPIVMLIEDWHGHPHKDMDVLMKKEASRRNSEQDRQNDSSSDQAAISSPPTTDPDVIPPISSVWDTTSVLGKPRKPPLAFPAYKPLAGKTHLHGYWKGNGNWVSYTPPIEWNELPGNVSYASDHWVGRFLPDKS